MKFTQICDFFKFVISGRGGHCELTLAAKYN